MTEKKERKMTPVGEAKWAHIHTPKAPFKDDRGNTKGEPKYQIDIIFNKGDKEWDSWAAAVMTKLRAVVQQYDKNTGQPIPKQTPIKRELDESDQPTGRYYITLKTSDRFKPGVFDVYGRPVPETVLVGNGSLVRASYTENEYVAFGGGINFYLNAVQVVKLVEYKSQNAEAYGFPVEPMSDAPFDTTPDMPWSEEEPPPY